MNAALSFVLHALYQLVLVVSLNKFFSLEIVGIYFSVLAVITPLANFLTLGVKQFVVSCSEDSLGDVFRVRVFTYGVSVFLIVTALVIYCSGARFVRYEALLLFSYLASVKCYEQVLEFLIPLSERANKKIHLFSSFIPFSIAACLLFISSTYEILSLDIYLGSLSLAVLVNSLIAFTFCRKLLAEPKLISRPKLYDTLRMFKRLTPLGLGLVVIGLIASLPRYVVDVIGSKEDIGAFGNIVYSYILGMIVVNGLAIKAFKSSSARKERDCILSLIGLFALGFIVLIFLSEEILVFVFGQSMADYAIYLLIAYFPICFSLIASFYDFKLVKAYKPNLFWKVNLIVLASSVVVCIFVYFLHMSAIVSGVIVLGANALVKLVIQYYLLARKAAI